MRVLLLSQFLLLAPLFRLCTSILVDPHNRMLGGEVTNSGFVIRSYMVEPNMTRTCTGSIVAPDLILTNAICVTTKPDRAFVILGTNQNHAKFIDSKFWDTTGLEMYQITYACLHPNYGQVFKHANNIALLKLENPMENAKILALPRRIHQEKKDIFCMTWGWGQNAPGQIDHKLRQANISIRPKFIQGINRTVFVSTTTVCPGDAGGPLICNGAFRGIASFELRKAGHLPCSSTSRGIFLDVARYRKFVEGGCQRGNLRRSELLVWMFCLAGLWL